MTLRDNYKRLFNGKARSNDRHLLEEISAADIGQIKDQLIQVKNAVEAFEKSISAQFSQAAAESGNETFTQLDAQASRYLQAAIKNLDDLDAYLTRSMTTVTAAADLAASNETPAV